MIGQTILNYQIISLLGEGGMGTVYLAEHVKLGRKVAIKVLLPHFVKNELVRSRFINEAKLMSNLHHPNIVTLYDYHEDENGLSLIMELVEGKPLDEYIQEVTGPIQEKEAIQLMKQALEGFGYAHLQGLIHRDIKPSNLIVTKDKVIKILDFGIAKLVSDLGSKLTKTGSHIGTVYYMSPEQVRGKELDLRSDIYSLGITFYQMLTGFCPYEGLTTEFDVFNKIVGEELPDPRTIYPGISEHMCHVIQKATSKDADERFQTCAEFIKGLKKDNFIVSNLNKSDDSDIGKSVLGNVEVNSEVIVDNNNDIEELNENQLHNNNDDVEVKTLDRKNNNRTFAMVGLVALLIIIGLFFMTKKEENKSDGIISTAQESKAIEEKQTASSDKSMPKPQEQKIESKETTSSIPKNIEKQKNTKKVNPPVSNPEENLELEMGRILESERMNPTEFLTFSHDGGRKTFLDDIKINVNITNTAKATSYNNFVVEIIYYDRNGNFKGSDKETIYTTLNPGYKLSKELKFIPPFRVKNIDIQIVSANPLY
jgi:serine/threonine protein kinase